MQRAAEHNMRRCIGCRVSFQKRALLRFVWDGAGLAADVEQRRPGRGAYVHKANGCLAKVLDVKRWEQALRLRPGMLSGESVRSLVQAVMGDEQISARRSTWRKVRL